MLGRALLGVLLALVLVPCVCSSGPLAIAAVLLVWCRWRNWQRESVLGHGAGPLGRDTPTLPQAKDV